MNSNLVLFQMLYLIQHCQQPFDGGLQGVGRLADLVVVDCLLLLHSLQSLLSLAQSAFHLLQLLGQGFVGLLQLRFNLCIFIWNETQHKVRWRITVKAGQQLRSERQEADSGEITLFQPAKLSKLSVGV